MQTCSYCLREIPEYISFCFYCNKTANVSFLKLADPDLSHFLVRLKEAYDFNDLDLFDYLSKKTIRIDIQEEIEIQSTEEIARPITEEAQKPNEVLREQEKLPEGNSNSEKRQKESLNPEQELLEKEVLEEVYFSISLDDDFKQEDAKETQDKKNLSNLDSEEQAQDKKIFFDSELEESQYISLTDVLAQRQKTQKRSPVQTQAVIPIPKKEALPESLPENPPVFSFENRIPENCDYLLFGDVQKGEAEILGRCQEEKYQYIIFEEKQKEKREIQSQKKTLWVWLILFLGIILGIFIGRLF